MTFARASPAATFRWAARWFPKKIAEYFDDHLLSCGLTYSGHPLACAAGVACVNYYEEAKTSTT